MLNTANFFINIRDLNPAPLITPQPMEITTEKHSYTTEIVSAEFLQESFLLYKKYQIAVHHDPPNKINRNGYEGFLCGNNLIKEKPSENHRLGLGNFHVLHRIDGKLVAVGVLDFLPSGVSSVYFFYDPEYSGFSLGVVGALKEIELVKNHSSESFKYYYLGFYINSCQKMRYKGEYLPSELLCPKNYVWVDIQKCLKNPETHDFKSLHQCSEETANQKDESMD